SALRFTSLGSTVVYTTVTFSYRPCPTTGPQLEARTSRQPIRPFSMICLIR
ncbi:hypothetical protein ASPFODRAFT_52167, partial [Aspergillus luchuensis CBS 106.47]